MDRRNLARRAKNSVSFKPDHHTQYAVKKAAKKSLSPLQRLQKFKKIVERQSKQPKTKVKKNLRVTFALDMEVENVVVNGSHEPDSNDVEDQKILKPRKPELQNEKGVEIALTNGNDENGSVADTVEIAVTENGHDEELENNENAKPVKRSSRISEKRESTPKKQVAKEATPKPESVKRELRQRTPQKETTPKPETPSKRRGRAVKNYKSDEAEVKTAQKNGTKEEDGTGTSDKVEEIITINDSVEDNQETKSGGFFSMFRRSASRSPVEIKDSSVSSPSSPSVICLDSPSYTERKLTRSTDIRGRKAINAFARFPGRNISITSVDSSSPSKRKADDLFCEDSPRKRFAGETESDSEKSPGWRFFSPKFGRMWSPSQQKVKSPLLASTPFGKGKCAEEDSMAVNYNDDTKLSLDSEVASTSSEISPAPAKTQWPCAVM